MKLNNSFKNCICQNLPVQSSGNVLKEFSKVRVGCPALKKIFLPDEIWKDFNVNIIKMLYNETSTYNYSSFLAYDDEELSNYTNPVHRYLLDENGIIRKDAVGNNHIKDLQENWMNKSADYEKFEKYRIYQRHLKELQYAYYLENNGWTIDNLSALGGRHDISGSNPKNIKYDIEVKYIGTEEWFNQSMKKELRNEGNYFQPSFHHSRNYLLLIIFQACKQLIEPKIDTPKNGSKQIGEDNKKLKMVSILIEHFNHYEVSIDQNLLNMKELEFIGGGESWLKVLKDTDQKKKPENTKIDLKNVTQSVDEIRIFSIRGNSFHLESKMIKIN